MAWGALYEAGRCLHQPLPSLHFSECARALSRGGKNLQESSVGSGGCAWVIRIGKLRLYQLSQPVSQPLTTYYLARV